MSATQDLDIFKRSLAGDRRARMEFFKKFIMENSHVRAYGVAYRQMDDFLHDCFANVLRTGHTFAEEQDLGDWVESVAAWTALERRRFRDSGNTGVTGRVRLCAGIEGDLADSRAPLISYAPPRSGPAESLPSRMAALVGEPQFTLLSLRGIENKSWEAVAAAAGKPLNNIGPMMVRTIDRLSRFFGAPPPLNVELELVFMGRSKHGSTSKPDGRVLAMRLDPEFHSPTPELRKIGLSIPQEVRAIVLWDAARASTPPDGALRDHLAQCHYCADLLRALLLMQHALQSGPSAEFLLCPGGFTLVNPPKPTVKAFHQHLAECPLCPGEQTGILEDGELVAAAVAQKSGVSPGMKIAGAGAVLLLLLGGVYLAHRHYVAPTAFPVTSQAVANEPPAPTLNIDKRYLDLAEQIPVTDAKWFPSVLPADREAFLQILDVLQHGHTAEAALTASGLAEKDPGVQMLYSVILYRQNSIGEGYRAMTRAEAMPPRDSFRCWAMLQCALIVGDLKTVARETEHLSKDPEYAQRAKAVLARAKARG